MSNSIGNIVLNVSVVDIDKVIPNPWNYNEQHDRAFEAEKESIQDNGMFDPILVRNHPDKDKPGCYEIIDGYHRWLGCKQLGFTEIPVNNLGDVPDEKAKKLTIVCNETRGKANKLKLSELLVGIQDSLALTIEDETERLEEMLRGLPYDEQDYRSLVELSDLDWGILDTEEAEPLENDPTIPENQNGSSEEEEWIAVTFKLTQGAKEVLDEACEKVKSEMTSVPKNKQIALGMFIEYLAAEYLNG